MIRRSACRGRGLDGLREPAVDPGPQRGVVPMSPGSPRAACAPWPGTSTRSTGSVRWNLLYGPRGFVQYQFAVPPSGAT